MYTYVCLCVCVNVFLSFCSLIVPQTATDASKIALEQSQTDRSKRSFVPHPIVVHTSDVTKMTVRLG